MGFRKSQLLPAPALDGSFVSAGQEVMRMSQETYDSLYAAWPNEMVVSHQLRWGTKWNSFGEATGMLGSALRSGTRKHQINLLSKEKAALAVVRVACSLAGGGSYAPHGLQIRILLPHLLFANLEYSCTRGLCSLVPDTVRALLHQPHLCFYLP